MRLFKQIVNRAFHIPRIRERTGMPVEAELPFWLLNVWWPLKERIQKNGRWMGTKQ